jgi:hypothetical protein
MVNNDWLNIGDPVDFDSPPAGRLIHAKYKNGDELSVNFFEIKNPEDFEKNGLNKNFIKSITLPVTGVKITNKIADGAGGYILQLDPDKTNLSGLNIKGGLIMDCPVGIQIGEY